MTNAEKHRVLVIDDSEIARRMISYVLKAHGFDVQSAAGPFELDALLDRFRPHVILLDLCMPDVEEEHLPEIVRALRLASGARILMHTASDPETLSPVVVSAGFDGQLPKTHDERELVDTIRAWAVRSAQGERA